MRIGMILKIVSAVVVLAFAGLAIFLLTFDANRYKGEIEALVQQETGRKLSLKGDLSLKLFPAVGVSAREAAFANAPGGSKPIMASVGELIVGVEVLPLVLRNDLNIKIIVLRNVDLLLEVDAAGRGNWDIGAPKTSSTTSPNQQDNKTSQSEAVRWPQLDKVQLENVRLTYRSTPKDNPGTIVDIKSFTVSQTKFERIALNGEVNFRDELIALSGSIGALPLLFDPSVAYPIDLSLTAGGVKADLVGTITHVIQAPQIDLRFDAKTDNLAKLNALTGANLTNRSATIGAEVVGDIAKEISIRGFELKFGKSRAVGEATIKMDGRRPQIKASLSSPFLDIEEITTVEQKPSGIVQRTQHTPARPQRLFSSDPLPVSALGAVDASLQLGIDVLKLPKLQLNDVKAAVELNDRNLVLKPVSMIFADGALNGAMEFSGRNATPTLNMNITGRSIDIGKLLRAFGENVLETKGDMAIQLVGAGTSIAAIMGSLDGRSEVIFGQGQIRSRWADILSTNIVQVAMPWTLAQSETRLNCVVSRFDVRRGLATSRVLLADADRMSVTGGGQINFGTERIDMQILPKPKDPGALSPSIPIEIKGWLGDPTFGTGVAGVAKGVVGLATGLVMAPVELAAPLVGNAPPPPPNPCVAAVSGKTSSPQAQAPATSPQPSAQGGVGGFIQGVGDGVKGLFGTR